MNIKSLFMSVIGIIISISCGIFVYNQFVSATISQESANLEVSEVTSEQVNSGAPSDKTAFNPPSMDDVPDGPMKEAILYGYDLVNETHSTASDKVGANLSCTSCHAGAGLTEVATLVGVMADYPKYMPRPDDIITIEERINGCMVRSMNGEKFEANSKELEAMVAYFKYISEGAEIGGERPYAKSADMKVIPTPSVSDGETLYQKSCIACHAADGSGNGPNVGPALWGDTSFNDGAGLARLSKMAGYIQAYMPIGGEKTLSDQEAADLAAYILTQDRPVWKNHDKDWANGAPSDIMTEDRRKQAQNGTLDWEEVIADFK